jgi:hypothetical protein
MYANCGLARINAGTGLVSTGPTSITQPTGLFKIRGATNALARLTADENNAELSAALLVTTAV